MDWDRRPLARDIGRLAAFRRRHPSLLRGATDVLRLEPDLLVLRRAVAGEAALVVVNLGSGGWPVPGSLLAGGRLVEEALAGSRVAVSPAAGLLDAGGPVPVPPGAVWVGILEPTGAGFAPARPESVRVRFVASGVPLGPGDEVRLAGAGPDLGNWDPERAAGPFTAGSEGWVLDVPAPSGTVLEAKLVVRRADGGVAWQPGEDRYALVHGGMGPVAVEW